jgi:hypothetical protein
LFREYLSYGRRIFTAQKKIVRIMVGANLEIHVEACSRDTSRYLCHVFSLINFIVNMKEQF